MKPCLTVVSLGPGDPELLNAKTIRAIKEAKRLILRTGVHPVASWLDDQGISYTTLDRFYDEADNFDCLYQDTANYLLKQAADSDLVYAVADACTDQTVRELGKQNTDKVDIQIIPGVSRYDAHLSSCIPLLDNAYLQIAPANDLLAFCSYDPNQTLLVTEIDNPLLAGQVKIALSAVLEDEKKIFIFQGDSKPKTIFLYELDRQKEYDHRTSILIPGSDYLHRSRFVLKDLETLMDYLRSPEGCPWDRSQTHESLRSFLIEEAWECVAAIDQQDTAHLSEELGDLLFQIVFHASIGSSCGEFSFSDIVTSICAKMIRRHPHVFEKKTIADRRQLSLAWEQVKQQETGKQTPIQALDDVSVALPSLKYASKLIKKLNGIPALQRNTEQILSEMRSLIDHLESNRGELSPESDLGSLLMLIVFLSGKMNVDCELVLHRTADKLKERMRIAEIHIKNDGKSFECLTFEELCVYLKHVEGEIE